MGRGREAAWDENYEKPSRVKRGSHSNNAGRNAQSRSDQRPATQQRYRKPPTTNRSSRVPTVDSSHEETQDEIELDVKQYLSRPGLRYVFGIPVPRQDDSYDHLKIPDDTLRALDEAGWQPDPFVKRQGGRDVHMVRLMGTECTHTDAVLLLQQLAKEQNEMEETLRGFEKLLSRERGNQKGKAASSSTSSSAQDMNNLADRRTALRGAVLGMVPGEQESVTGDTAYFGDGIGGGELYDLARQENDKGMEHSNDEVMAEAHPSASHLLNPRALNFIDNLIEFRDGNDDANFSAGLIKTLHLAGYKVTRESWRDDDGVYRIEVMREGARETYSPNQLIRRLKKLAEDDRELRRKERARNDNERIARKFGAGAHSTIPHTTGRVEQVRAEVLNARYSEEDYKSGAIYNKEFLEELDKHNKSKETSVEEESANPYWKAFEGTITDPNYKNTSVAELERQLQQKDLAPSPDVPAAASPGTPPSLPVPETVDTRSLEERFPALATGFTMERVSENEIRMKRKGGVGEGAYILSFSDAASMNRDRDRQGLGPVAGNESVSRPVPRASNSGVPPSTPSSPERPATPAGSSPGDVVQHFLAHRNDLAFLERALSEGSFGSTEFFNVASRIDNTFAGRWEEAGGARQAMAHVWLLNTIPRLKREVKEAEGAVQTLEHEGRIDHTFDGRFEKEFGISESDLEVIPGYLELSPNQRAFLYENLKDYADRGDSRLGAIWDGICSHLGTERSPIPVKGTKGIEAWGSHIRMLMKISEGMRVYMHEGKVEPDYLGVDYDRLHRDEQYKATLPFNHAVHEFARVPGSWQVEPDEAVMGASPGAIQTLKRLKRNLTASLLGTPKREQYNTARATYEEAKRRFVTDMLQAGKEKEEIARILVKAEGNLHLHRFIETNPEAVDTLLETTTPEMKRMTGEDIAAGAIYFGAGFASRVAIKATFVGWVAGPLIATTIGATRGWNKESALQRERDRRARRGQGAEDEEYKQLLAHYKTTLLKDPSYVKNKDASPQDRMEWGPEHMAARTALEEYEAKITALNIVPASRMISTSEGEKELGLIGKLNDAIKNFETYAGSTEVKRRLTAERDLEGNPVHVEESQHDRALAHLKRRVEYVRDKLNLNRIDFGDRNTYALNKAALEEALMRAEVLLAAHEFQDVYHEIRGQDKKRRLLNRHEASMVQARYGKKEEMALRGIFDWKEKNRWKSFIKSPLIMASVGAGLGWLSQTESGKQGLTYIKDKTVRGAGIVYDAAKEYFAGDTPQAEIRKGFEGTVTGEGDPAGPPKPNIDASAAAPSPDKPEVSGEYRREGVHAPNPEAGVPPVVNAEEKVRIRGEFGSYGPGHELYPAQEMLQRMMIPGGAWERAASIPMKEFGFGGKYASSSEYASVRKLIAFDRSVLKVVPNPNETFQDFLTRVISKLENGKHAIPVLYPRVPTEVNTILQNLGLKPMEFPKPSLPSSVVPAAEAATDIKPNDPDAAWVAGLPKTVAGTSLPTNSPR